MSILFETSTQHFLHNMNYVALPINKKSENTLLFYVSVFFVVVIRLIVFLHFLTIITIPIASLPFCTITNRNLRRRIRIMFIIVVKTDDYSFRYFSFIARINRYFVLKTIIVFKSSFGFRQI